MKHAVIILNYKGWQDTLLCLDSINQTIDKPHIIVVDNNSSNNSVVKIKSKFPGIDLIESTKNLGYAGGNNLGIKRALKLGAKVIHLLNNDTTVDKHAFDKAYRFVNGKDQITGGKIYYAKGFEYHRPQKGKGNILWYAGGSIDWHTAVAKHRGVDEQDKGQYDSVEEVDFITGCYLSVPAHIFEKVGYFDEKFFLYLEDADFTLRTLKAGYKAYYNPEIIIYHRNSSTTKVGSPLVDYYLTRNRYLLARKHAPLRLNLALLKEGVMRNMKNPIRRQAFLDYLTHHLGNRNEQIQKVIKP